MGKIVAFDEITVSVQIHGMGSPVANHYIITEGDVVGGVGIAAINCLCPGKMETRDGYISPSRYYGRTHKCNGISRIRLERNRISRTARRRLRPARVRARMDIAGVARYCGIGAGLDGGIGLAGTDLADSSARVSVLSIRVIRGLGRCVR